MTPRLITDGRHTDAAPADRTRTGRRTTGALLTTAVAAVLLAGCSSAAAPAAPAAPAKDQAAACTAAVAVDSSIPPGIDPDGPAPSAQEMQAWAATVAPHLATLQANAPDTLAAPLKTYADQLAQAQAGQRLDVSTDANVGATATLDGWVFDTCGYQTLDVTNSAGTLTGVPTGLTAGPVAIRFRNSGDPSAFVLLTARVKDGQTVTPQQLDSGAADLDAAADVVSGAQAAGTDAAYSVAVLRPGNYVVSAVLGTPPNFAGTTSGAFTVS
ncbi:hypothetical protein [Pseudonocardia xishanensis]|uniref:Lipoprotein n=1 Tax=Pseudonocardia xishanensis TaxID=630995 RepID=A0ABP8RIC2_9PSEU